MKIAYEGQTWNTSTESDVQVTNATGIEEWATSAATIGGSGTAAGAPTSGGFGRPNTFTVDLTVFADSDEAMATAIDAIKAATMPAANKLEARPLTYTLNGQEDRTVFVRVLTRSPATDLRLPR